MKAKSRIVSVILLLALLVTTCATGVSLLVTAATTENISVWIIAGQSNAEGYAPYNNSKYPDDGKIFEDDERFENGFAEVLYWGNTGSNLKYNAQKTTGFTNVKLGLGQNANSVGAEVGIAAKAVEMGGKHAIIKCTAGSTQLYPRTISASTKTYGSWTSPSYIANNLKSDPYYNSVKYDYKSNGDVSKTTPVVDESVKIQYTTTAADGTQTTVKTDKQAIGYLYNVFVNETIKPAIEELRKLGYNPIIRGIWWMQGEAEAWEISNDASNSPENTRVVYTALLRAFITDLRKDLTQIMGHDCSFVPFFIGKIYFDPVLGAAGGHTSPPPNYEAVRAAQTAVANSDLVAVEIIDIQKECSVFSQKDYWHFRAPTQKWIGEQVVSRVLLGTSTKYGIIPTEFEDVEKYPLAVFNNGVFVGASASFTDKNFKGALDMARDSGDGAAILVRRDYETSGKFSNLSNIKGTVTLDLNGFTLSPSNSTENQKVESQSIFSADAKPYSNGLIFDTTLIVKNGTLKSSASTTAYSPIINFNTWYNSTSGDPYGDLVKNFTFNFENVKFVASQDNTTLIAGTSKTTAPEEKNAILNINLTNCEVDMNGKTGITLFNEVTPAADATLTKINPTFIGGNITAVSESDFIILNARDTGDTTSKVTLTRIDNKHLTMTLDPASPAPAFSYTEPDGEVLVYAKPKDADGKLVYSLINSLEALYDLKTQFTFGEKPTLSIYFPKNETAHITVDKYVKDLATLDTVTLENVEYYLIQMQFDIHVALRDVAVAVDIRSGDVGETMPMSYTLNIVKYAESALTTATPEESAMIKDTLAYIRAMYLYFGYKNDKNIAATEALLGEGYNENNMPAFASDTALSPKPGEGIRGVAIILDGAPKYRFYISGYATKFTFTQNGVTLKTEKGIDNLGKYIDVFVEEESFADAISYSVSGKGYSGSYNLKSYYDYIKASDPENVNLINLVERLGRYTENRIPEQG